jgi:SAM-dependent methyltransferase
MTEPTASLPDPAPLMALSTAHWGAQTLLTANRLGLFALLAARPLPAAAVATELGTAERATRLMLNACAGLGLLEQTEHGYRNSRLAEAFLVPGRPGFLGDALRYSDDLYATWGRLGDALVSGRPQLPAEDYLGRDAAQTRHFVRGMHNRAIGIGRALVSMVDLGGRRRLLDVGGGPGTYSALLAQRYPHLEATVLDLPDVVAIAGEILAELDVAERVGTLAGDYKTTALPGGNDVVLISGVFHRETEARCRDLIVRARDALVPGGLLVISDVFTDAGGCEPAFAALFGLNMLLTAEDGGVHSDAAVAGWLVDAGMDDIARKAFPPPMPHRVVMGVKR